MGSEMCIRDRISGGVPISGFTEEVRLLGNGRIDLTWLGLEKSQYLPVSVILIAVVFFLKII